MIRIKHFLQRLFRGYSDMDLWNLDIHLSELIYKRLIAFKKMKRTGLPPNCPDSIVWEYILDHIIETFRIISESDWDTDEELPHETFSSRNRIKRKDGIITYIIPKWKGLENKPIMDNKLKKMEQQNKKVQEGLKLFAKYFKELWD